MLALYIALLAGWWRFTATENQNMEQGLCDYWSPVGDAKLLPADHSGSAGLAPLHPEAAGSVGEEIRTSLLKHERKQTGSCWGAARPPVLPFPTNNTTAAGAGLHIYIQSYVNFFSHEVP